MEIITRYKGLTTQQVEQRVLDGRLNISRAKTSRSVGSIVRANVFTRFNALLSVLFVVVLLVGSPIDGLFFIAVIINSGMGIAQELRAKRVLDKLAILVVPHVIVRRDGSDIEISSESIVSDDLVYLKIGDQVPTDGIVTETSGVEIDEALLTGEADPVAKNPGDTVLSGSIIVTGQLWYKVTAVGDDSYAHTLTAKVKIFKKAHSELLHGTNKLLGYISIIILLVAPLLVWGQLTRTGVSLQEASIRSIAAIVGMIPEGLVVLTSFAFVLASLTLARRKVLVQELPAVEGLARVNVICLDKTGTLTEGRIVFKKLVLEQGVSSKDVGDILSAFASNPTSPTLEALHGEFGDTSLTINSEVAFSSKRKWSALNIDSEAWVLGAPEIVLSDKKCEMRTLANVHARDGYRVLALTHYSGVITDKKLPSPLTPVALVLLEEKIRDDAHDTLNYFKKQNIDLKIISGDNPETVAVVARKVGVEYDKPFDARLLPADSAEFQAIIQSHNVFGRVSPEQKLLFVKALQSAGNVVAMTGDGVNDALALKDADIGIAMGNGAPATKAVARLVLLDNQFAHMPYVLGEGRRVIANIERVANLFVIKNVYNLIFAVSVTILALSFPFLPRHLSLISWLTIGIPAFFLALAPNNRRYIPGFLSRVLGFALPVGTIVAVASMYTYSSILASIDNITIASSSAVISVVTIGLWVLVCLARPVNRWKLILITTMGAVFCLAISWSWLAGVLEFSSVWPYNFMAFVVGIIGAMFVELVWRYGKER